jgi:anti-anti-sigma factor
MNFKVEKKNKYAVITMQTSRLDVQSAAELRSELVLLSGESVKHMVIDLSKCEYCDTAGLSAILIANRLCQDGMLLLAAVPQNVESMLYIQRFNPELVLVANVEEGETRLQKVIA